MERWIGVEQARARLGSLVAEVAGGADPVVLTRRGQSMAVIVSREEYSRLKEAASRLARDELRSRLTEIRKAVADAGASPELVDEALEAVREMA